MSVTAQLTEQPEVSTTYAVDALDEQLGQFRGRVDPRAAVFDFLTEEMERNSQSNLPPGAGPPETTERLVQPISDYLALIIRIGEAVSSEVHKEFTNEQVRIAQVRASFDFRSWLVKVMFVIDADIEEELRFSQMLHQLENIVLHSNSFAAELDYVNKRKGPLDCDSLRRRYPFVARVKPGT